MTKIDELFDVLLETPVIYRLKPIVDSALDHAFWDFEQLATDVESVFILTNPSDSCNGEIVVIPYDYTDKLNRDEVYKILLALAFDAIENSKERGEFDFIEDSVSNK